MKCWKCQSEIVTRERIGFRDYCPTCERALHACRNCEFYDSSYGNQCREPMAERVVDKERPNFCGYFAPGRSPTAAGPKPAVGDARAKLEALFKSKRDAGGRR